MNFDLDPDAAPEEVVALLNKTGIIRIKNYLSSLYVSEIKRELLSIYDKMEPNYEYGKAIRTGQDWDVQHTPHTNNFFRNSEWMHSVATNYQDLKNGFQKDLFSTYDFLCDKGTGPQGWAHFDRLQRFKFFLYVTDVDIDCGPFCSQPGSHILTKKLRQKDPTPSRVSRWRFGRYFGDDGLDINYTESQNHYPEMEYELVPMIGPRGTLLIFDSDTIHRGGNVCEGRERIVARAHSW